MPRAKKSDSTERLEAAAAAEPVAAPPVEPVESPAAPPWGKRLEGLRPEQRKSLRTGTGANVPLEGPALAPYRAPRRTDATYWDTAKPAMAGPYEGPMGGPSKTSGPPRRSTGEATKPLEGPAAPFKPPRRTDY